MASGILERLRGDIGEYKPLVRWQWNGSLDIGRLNAQLDDIKASGAGGAILSAAKGLETGYLSEDWFACVSAALARADRLRLRLWIGIDAAMSGVLSEEANRARSLICRREERFDPKALGCYRIEEGRLYRLTDDDGSGCECVYACVSDSKADLLNWKVVRALIDEGCESYYRRYARYFGNLLSGFFAGQGMLTDGAIAYSEALAIKYKQRFNEDILDELGALFIPCEQAEGFRYKFWTVLNELYSEAFAAQLYRWCSERNCRLAGAWAGQDGFWQQLLCGAGEIPAAEFAHLPSVRLSDESSVRRVASAAAQLSKAPVLADLTLKEAPDSLGALKRLAERQFAFGASQLCLEAYPYELSGGRKRDAARLYAPGGANNALLKPFNRYFTCLGYLLANSREVVDTLLIYPMRSAYTGYDPQRADSLEKLEKGFRTISGALHAEGVLHHYGDEALIRKYGSVRNGKLKIGKCSYSAVVVPDVELLDESTVNLLDEFAKAGGKLCLASGQKLSFAGASQKNITLESTVKIDQLGNPGFTLTGDTDAVRVSVRRSEFGDFIYAVNLSETDAHSVSLRINAPGARLFLADKPGFAPLYFRKTAKGIDIPLTLEAGCSQIIFLSSKAESAPEAQPAGTQLIPTPEAIIEQADPNLLPLDAARLSLDGISYSELKPISAIRDELLSRAVNGTVYLKYCFHALARPAGLTLRCESGFNAQFKLNASELNPASETQESGFTVYPLDAALKIGANELTVRLDYYQREEVYASYAKGEDGTALPDTQIETMYVSGDFCLEKSAAVSDDSLASEKYSLTLPKRYVNLGNLAGEGFAYFSGAMRLRTVIRARGGETLIRLRGAYFAAKLSVNGGEDILLALKNEAHLEEALHPGDNTIRLTLYTGTGAYPREGEPERRLGLDAIEIG